jgi:hypothetical protein
MASRFHEQEGAAIGPVTALFEFRARLVSRLTGLGSEPTRMIRPAPLRRRTTSHLIKLHVKRRAELASRVLTERD